MKNNLMREMEDLVERMRLDMNGSGKFQEDKLHAIDEMIDALKSDLDGFTFKHKQAI